VSAQQARAIRTSAPRAKMYFDRGNRIAVSVNGEASFPVGQHTTTHSRETTTWDSLADAVKSYGDARQQYHVIWEA
jgi:hypothetical protein